MEPTPATPPAQAAALSPAEFAARYGVGLTKTYCALKSGDLPAKKWGRRTLIPLEAAEAWFSNLPAFAA